MRPLIASFLTLSVFGLSSCADADVARLMEGYLWEKRVLLVFSPAFEHKGYQYQNKLIQEDVPGAKERNLVVWRFVLDKMVSVDDEVKAHLATQPFYDYFDIQPNEFAVILLGKDGEEKLKQNKAVSSNELFELVDAMPMRRREMQQDDAR